MIKQAVLYKLATLRLAINYVLRSRMVKQADGLQGRMFNPANRRRGTYTAGSYQAPSSPEPMSIPVGASKNTTIQDNMNPQNNPWAWDNSSNPQAQPVAMGASKPIPRQPKPVQQPISYPKSKMIYRGGKYYGRGNINTWGDQIAEERNRLNSIYEGGTDAQKAKWEQSYQNSLNALNDLESRWNSFNDTRNSGVAPMKYNAKSNTYYPGADTYFASGTNPYDWGIYASQQRKVLDQAYNLLSPQQKKNSEDWYNQRIQALDKFDNQWKHWDNYFNVMGPGKPKLRYNSAQGQWEGEVTGDTIQNALNAYEAIQKLQDPRNPVRGIDSTARVNELKAMANNKHLNNRSPIKDFAGDSSFNQYIQSLNVSNPEPVHEWSFSPYSGLDPNRGTVSEARKRGKDSAIAEDPGAPVTGFMGMLAGRAPTPMDSKIRKAKDQAETEFNRQGATLLEGLTDEHISRYGNNISAEQKNSIRSSLHTISALLGMGFALDSGVAPGFKPTSHGVSNDQIQQLLDQDRIYAQQGHAPGEYLAMVANNLTGDYYTSGQTGYQHDPGTAVYVDNPLRHSDEEREYDFVDNGSWNYSKVPDIYYPNKYYPVGYSSH